MTASTNPGPLFRRDDPPASVLARVLEHGQRWEDLTEDDRELGVAKLRLAGVYDDRHEGTFMLRTRIPGGRLEARQLETVAEVVRRFGRRPDGGEGPDRTVEITTRQDLQLHWIRFEALPEIWRRYREVGLTTLQACGDTLRNVTSCPVDGVAADAVLDAGPTVAALGELARDEARLTAFLPRKFKVAVTGCPTDCVVARVNDLGFTPAARDGEPGFHVHAGGGLSDSPRLASALDLFVPPRDVPTVVRAALGLFVERGDFEHKAVNRFRVLVHELGPDAVTEELRRRADVPLSPAGEDRSTWRAEDHLGVRADRGSTHSVGLSVPVGRLHADELAELARLAAEHGDGGIRLTQRQDAIITGVADPDRLLAEPLLEHLRPEPDPFSRAVVACTSAPFCKFGILNAKAYGADLIEHLRATLPPERWEALRGVRIHLSGCKASCAQVQTAHVGLRATMAHGEDSLLEAFDLALGGDAGAGRLAAWTALEIPADRALDRVASLLAAAAEHGGPEAISRADADAAGEGAPMTALEASAHPVERDPAADVRDRVAAESGVPELADKIWFHKTAAAVIDAGRCVGCGGCIAACPSRSLAVGTDGHPTLVRMCTGCSACWDACPMAGLRTERLARDLGALDGRAEGSHVGRVLAAWSARAVAPAPGAQDGGIVTAVLAHALERGEVDGVIVTRRLDAFRGEAVIATSAEEVRAAAGSVYHQGHPLEALNRPLPPGIRSLAVVGTPCQLSALRALQRAPWPARRTAAGMVTLAIGLFCTRSLDPQRLLRLLLSEGVEVARIARLDVRDGQLLATHVDGEEVHRRPVSTVGTAALRGCDECADFPAWSADLAVGNAGSASGRSTVLIRTDAGARALEGAVAAGGIEAIPLDDLAPIERVAARNHRRAERSVHRGLDAAGPLWIAYSEHVAAYEGTDRAPQGPPPHRSHHYRVSC